MLRNFYLLVEIIHNYYEYILSGLLYYYGSGIMKWVIFTRIVGMKSWMYKKYTIQFVTGDSKATLT